MRSASRGARRSVDRGACRPAIEPRKYSNDWGAALSLYAEGNTDRRDSASACSTLRGLRPWHVGTLFAGEPGDLLLGRRSYFQSGPHREDEESKPMKNE